MGMWFICRCVCIYRIYGDLYKIIDMEIEIEIEEEVDVEVEVEKKGFKSEQREGYGTNMEGCI